MYFDGCYFDPAYFDASVCGGPDSSGGRGGRRLFRRPPPVLTPKSVDLEDDLFVVRIL